MFGLDGEFYYGRGRSGWVGAVRKSVGFITDWMN